MLKQYANTGVVAIFMSDISTIKKKFKSSVRRGTGESYIILKAYPKIDFSKDIIDTSIKNYAFDIQVEGNRAMYAYRLIKLSNQKEKIIGYILKKLRGQKKDWYSLDQMCELTKLIAKEGNNEARAALYERFENNLKNGFDFCGQNSIIELDGIDGLKKVAEVVGKVLHKNPTDSEDSYKVDSFQKKNKKIRVYDELEKAAKTNKYIAIYLKSIKQNKWSQDKKFKRKKWDYNLVKENIDLNKMRTFSSIAANELSQKDIIKLANDFKEESKNERIKQYLRVFEYVKYPFDYKDIFNIALTKRQSKKALIPDAVSALKGFSKKNIRDFAIKELKRTKSPDKYLSLLVGNYKKGDYKLLNSIIDKSADYDYIHSIVFGLVDIFETNRTKECKEPLERIYDKLNCGLHRHTLVDILDENQVLSDKIRQELKFDSYEPIRKKYK